MGTSKENPDVSEMNAGFKLRVFCAPYTLVSDPYNVYIISGSLFTMHSPILNVQVKNPCSTQNLCWWHTGVHGTASQKPIVKF